MNTNLSDTGGALICDLDGTLVDSAPDLAGALCELLKSEGRPPLSLEQVTSMIGDGVAKLVERGFNATGGCPEPKYFHDLVRRFLSIYNGRLVVETRPYPGVVETLAALKAQGWRLLICTNKPEAASREILEALELAPFFDAVAGGDSFDYRKPDPRHLTSLLMQSGATEDRAIMFGDGQADVAAARAAGIPCILAEFGYGGRGARTQKPDLGVGSFAELPSALYRLVASAEDFGGSGSLSGTGPAAEA